MLRWALTIFHHRNRRRIFRLLGSSRHRENTLLHLPRSRGGIGSSGVFHGAPSDPPPVKVHAV